MRAGSWLLIIVLASLVTIAGWCSRVDDAGPASLLEIPEMPRPTPVVPEQSVDFDVREPAPTSMPQLASNARGLRLVVQLRGLHEAARWGGPLRLSLEGRDEGAAESRSHHDAVTPNAEGRATFVVPDWCASASQQKGRLDARVDGYQPVEVRWEGARDLTQTLNVDVQVVGLLSGRVVDESGQPVSPARVSAYAVATDGTPVDLVLAHRNTRPDGTFSLPVPPAVTLWLLVAPMQASQSRRKILGDDGGQQDDGRPRTGLMPVGIELQADFGAVRAVGDIVLRGASDLVGAVRWPDGTPIHRAHVFVAPKDGVRLHDSERLLGCLLPGGRVALGGSVTTDERGGFAMPAVAGARYEVRVTDAGEGAVIGSFEALVVPPQRADFTIPRPTRLRVVEGGRVVPLAVVDVESHGLLRTDAAGVATVVAARGLRVRASHERMRSPWLDVPVNAAGTTVDVTMVEALVALSIEFEGEIRVRNTKVSWRSVDGRDGAQLLWRDDRPGPFQLFLEPGRYRVDVGPGGGERNGVFLLPTGVDVDLVDGPRGVVVPAQFGGSFSVVATDRSGVAVAGTCRILDASGREVPVVFEVRSNSGARVGRPGELLAGGVNVCRQVLSAGAYELSCDFGPLGVHQERLAIVPREIAEVRVRLP